MRIHFVCKGNTFRSRLAEAYLKSKGIKNLIISSSGTEAKNDLNGPVCEYTLVLLSQNNILQYNSPTWTQTEKALLESQDLIIFIDKDAYNYCINLLDATINEFEIWDIPEIPQEILKDKPIDLEKAVIFARVSFNMIQNKVSELIETKKLFII